MKKILLIALVSMFVGFAVRAQRYAIIDTKYILNKMPEYTDADKKLQEVSDQWQKEIDQRQSELDKMYKDYDAEKFMLSDDLKKKREDCGQKEGECQHEGSGITSCQIMLL